MKKAIALSLLTALSGFAAAARADTPEPKMSVISCAVGAATPGTALGANGLVYVIATYADLVSAAFGQPVTVDLELQTQTPAGSLPTLLSYSGFTLAKGAAPNTLALTGTLEGQAVSGVFSTSGTPSPATLTVGTDKEALTCAALNIAD